MPRLGLGGAERLLAGSCALLRRETVLPQLSAAAAVLRAAGRGGELEVRLRGGRLRVTSPGEGHAAILHGPAVEVFQGQWDPSALA